VAVSSTLKKGTQWLFAGFFQAPTVSALESFLMRLIFAGIALYSILHGVDKSTEPHPVGLLKVLHWIDDDRTWLGWLSDPGIFAKWKLAMAGALVLYVTGFALPIVLPAVALLHILPFTLYNSQGYTHHGYQIVSLTLLVQALTVWFHIWRKKKFSWLPPDMDLRSWLLWQSQMLICGTYLVSIFSKLENSGGMWLWNANYVAMDMVKTQRQNYLNKLDPQFEQPPEQAIWMLDHPWTARVMFGSGFLLEAFCIFAIGRRGLGFLIGVSIIVFHRSIDALMGLVFLYNELLVAVFIIGIPFGLAWALGRLPGRLTGWGVALGALLGIVASWFFHPWVTAEKLDLVRYLFDTVNSCGVLATEGLNWLSREILQVFLHVTGTSKEIAENTGWVRHAEFLKPMGLPLLVGAVVGGVVGWIAGIRWSTVNGQRSTVGSDA
jgi:hypothetical protein